MATVAVAAVLGMAAVSSGEAQSGVTANLEVRVWQNVRDDLDISISARPEGGSWRTLGTVGLPLDDGVSDTGYRYGDIALDVPLRAGGPAAAIEVRVWQNIGNPRLVYISARYAGGLWSTLGTVRLPMEELSLTGRFRYSDITLEVPIPEGDVTTLVGRQGFWGFQDGSGTSVLFGGRAGAARHVALAAHPDGRVIIVDNWNNAIRELSTDGIVTTLAGRNGYGDRDGSTSVAQFQALGDVDVDGEGNIYIADRGNELIRKITPDGAVSTIAGGGEGIAAGPALEAELDQPRGVALDGAGNLYILEKHRILRLATSGTLSVVAGGGGRSQVDGPRERAQFAHLHDLDIDDAGNVYVIDIDDGQNTEFAAIRKVDVSGMVTTLLHSKPPSLGGLLAYPNGIAVTGDGTIFIANSGRHQIVTLSADGELRGIAGTGAAGSADGPAGAATFYRPKSLDIMPDGSLVVFDQDGTVIRAITPAEAGFPPGPVALAEDTSPSRLEGVSVRKYASHLGLVPIDLTLAEDDTLFVGDNSDGVWRVTPGRRFATFAGNNGSGFVDGPASEAEFRSPEGIVLDSDGNILLAGYGNRAIRQIAPDGTVTTLHTFGKNPHLLEYESDGDLLVLLKGGIGGDEIVRITPEGAQSSVAVPQFDAITGMGVSPAGEIWIIGTDYLEGTTIMRRTSSGDFVTVLETDPGRWGGLFSIHVRGIDFSSDGMAYVTDEKYGRILRIAPDGTVATVLDREDFGSANFTPRGLVVTPRGRLLVTSGGLFPSEGTIWQITLPDE